MSVALEQLKVMTAEELRRGLGDAFDVVRTGQDVLIERRSKPVAVMIRYEDYTSIVAELEDKRDAQRAKEVREEIRTGKMGKKSLEQVKASLKEKGLLDD